MQALDTPLKPEPVRVFVAATPAEWLPMQVLAFSITEHTALPVEVSAIYTYQREIPLPAHAENRPRTPFSFQRFLIPQLCGYQGKALYLDADMQVFRDIAPLWNRPFAGHDLQTVGTASGERRSQFSVMLLDCARLKWDIDDIVAQLDRGTLTYAALMYDMQVAESVSYDLPGSWNSLEHFAPEDTCLLHYTDMNTQPWVSTDNRHGALWVRCLQRALAQGFIRHEQLLAEIRQGHVRPSLASQVVSADPAAWTPTWRELCADIAFSPPFYQLQALRRSRARTWGSKGLRVARLLAQGLR